MESAYYGLNLNIKRKEMNSQNWTINSPWNRPLHLMPFKSIMGFKQQGVKYYKGVMTFKELVNHFKAEKGSQEIWKLDKK